MQLVNKLSEYYQFPCEARHHTKCRRARTPASLQNVRAAPIGGHNSCPPPSTHRSSLAKGVYNMANTQHGQQGRCKLVNERKHCQNVCTQGVL